jgi:16S rRNA C967 or C1407 C5-methylase (RsmB/RsmF family)/NOL1/NOP2/fmu family ribosome biogenesis protein
MTEIHFPADFEKRMQEQLASEWGDFKLAHANPVPVSVRLNPKKSADGLAVTSVIPWAKTGRYLSQRPLFTLDPLFHAGSYYVQEASSMFLEQALIQATDLGKPLTVLDLSAAPGGKSTHLLSLINGDSLLVANEVIRSRAYVLSENIQKWGYPNCLVTNNDPSDFSNLNGFFDVIVVDAPCSGEGLFRKDRDAMDQWSTENVMQCASRQKRILNNIWPSLKENGILIYSTCTYNAFENEDNLNAFASANDLDFVALAVDASWNVESVKKGKAIGYRFFPHRVHGEGFFISVMRKKNSTPRFEKQKFKPRLAQASKKVCAMLADWVNESEHLSYCQHNDLVFALPEKCVAGIEQVLQHLRFVYAGVNIATFKHEKAVPEHALAVSVVMNRTFFETADLDYERSIQYLRRDPILLPDLPRGYVHITYRNMGLGWVNNLQSRVNNLYPQEWKIRMAAQRPEGDH